MREMGAYMGGPLQIRNEMLFAWDCRRDALHAMMWHKLSLPNGDRPRPMQ